MILGPKQFKGLVAGVAPRFLPFADAASAELPLGRLLRLSLFQVSVGMALVLLNGTLNRVMIVELWVPTWLVSLMIALPLLFAPARALIGHRSDHHRSYLGWRRAPYLWFGSLLQFGGLAIMPFALILLSGDQTTGPWWAGHVGAALAFLMVGAGLHTTQTAGLALATDVAPAASRGRVVALLYVALMAGMALSALVFGALLEDFSQKRLIEVVQGAAVVTIALNLLALWGQEPRRPDLTRHDLPSRPTLRQAWATLSENTRAGRLLLAVGLGTAGFAMQDVLLEPYGGEILGLGVGATTFLTALMAGGSLIGFALAARALGSGDDPCRVAAFGALIGAVGLSAVVLAHPMDAAWLFRAGVAVIGLGAGQFGVGALVAAMRLAEESGDGSRAGLALGAWGATQATAAGLAIAAGGALRDVVGEAATAGVFGRALQDPATGYALVYHIEIALLFGALAVIGPLVRPSRRPDGEARFGLAEFPT